MKKSDCGRVSRDWEYWFLLAMFLVFGALTIYNTISSLNNRDGVTDIYNRLEVESAP